MLLHLMAPYNILQEASPISTWHAAIIKVERDAGTYLGTIEGYLKAKYKGVNVRNTKSLEEAQKINQYSEMGKKTRHRKLCKAKANALSSLETLWHGWGMVKSPQ